jgi:hypothetical protein
MKILLTLILTYVGLLGAQTDHQEYCAPRCIAFYHQCDSGFLFQRFSLTQAIQEAFNKIDFRPVGVYEKSLTDNITYSLTYIFDNFQANVYVFPDLKALSIEFFYFGDAEKIEIFNSSMKQYLQTEMAEIFLTCHCQDSRP